MRRYEFKVVPAPKRGEKAKGAKTNEDRFAVAMTSLLNQLGQQGWDYVRSDTLQVEEKSGWARRATTVEHTVMVFRRPLESAVPEYEALAALGHDADGAAEETPEAAQHREAVEQRLRRDFTGLRPGRERGRPPAAPAGEEEPAFSARRDERPELRVPRLGPAREE